RDLRVTLLPRAVSRGEPALEPLDVRIASGDRCRILLRLLFPSARRAGELFFEPLLGRRLFDSAGSERRDVAVERTRTVRLATLLGLERFECAARRGEILGLGLEPGGPLRRLALGIGELPRELRNLLV